MGTFRYYLLYCDLVYESVSGVGFTGVGTCATERGESRDTPVGLGHLGRFHSEHARFNDG